MQSSTQISFQAFRSMLASEVAPALATAVPTGRVLLDLGLDDVALFRLRAVLQAGNRSFEIPDDCDLDFLTLGDLHHYFTSMGEGHEPRD